MKGNNQQNITHRQQLRMAFGFEETGVWFSLKMDSFQPIKILRLVHECRNMKEKPK